MKKIFFVGVLRLYLGDLLVGLDTRCSQLTVFGRCSQRRSSAPLGQEGKGAGLSEWGMWSVQLGREQLAATEMLCQAKESVFS